MDTPPPNTPRASEPVGPVVGIIIIILVLVAGGIYFLLMEQQKNEQPLGEEQASNTGENLIPSPNAI
ncbi:MAG: hypothetical protein U1C66_02415 [Patescibacteria group bacterium]|nr:hypothetical protein [Patescibacteria group bacterium]